MKNPNRYQPCCVWNGGDVRFGDQPMCDRCYRYLLDFSDWLAQWRNGYVLIQS